MARRKRKVGGPGSYTFRTEAALDVAERILKGETVSDIERDPLTWLEKFLRLDKPFTSYAPRTRRRYAAGARIAKRAPAIRAEERVKTRQRVTQKYGAHITPGQATRLNKLKKQILDTGVDIQYYMDDDIIKLMLQQYGYKYLVYVWEKQLDSLERYANGDNEPGKDRWVNRGTWETEYGTSFEIYLPLNTDPYYFYHGKVNY